MEKQIINKQFYCLKRNILAAKTVESFVCCKEKYPVNTTYKNKYTFFFYLRITSTSLE